MTQLFAPAKLTLSLSVVGVRSDGMHLIDAEMTSLSFGDDITVVDLGHGERSEVTLVGPAAGIMAGAAGEDDLVVRALELVDRAARVNVTKNVPAGAGLGGGSSDAAAILRWSGYDDVAEAARLGADVAFCVAGGRARVRGIGEIVMPLPQRHQTFTLLTPPIHCSTPSVYKRWDEMGGPTASGDHPNDLTAAAVDLYPEMGKWRDKLGDATGESPRLAGSGSTWFVEGDYPGGGRVVATTLAPPSV